MFWLLHPKKQPHEDSSFLFTSLTIFERLFRIESSRGSVQQRLNQETLKEVVIPILPQNKQEKISSFVKRSFDERKKAKELLLKAKRRVEASIEQKKRAGRDLNP